MKTASWKLCLLFPGMVLAAPDVPVADDFARGMALHVGEAAPAYVLPLPESVYRTATRRDLRDLRVFDAGGAIVQHALCRPDEPVERQRHLHDAGIWALPTGTAPALARGTQLEVMTADGTRLQVREGAAPADGAEGAFKYVLDARDVDEPLAELRLDWQWQTPEGRQQLALRVDASDDLDQWRTIVSSSTLLRAESDSGRLERSHISLPEMRYAYLRLVPLDQRARDWLRAAQLVSVQDAPALAPMTWFSAEALPADSAHTRYFRSDRQAPVQLLRFGLPAANLLLQVRVSSRDDADAAWRHRVTGTAVMADAGHDRAGLVIAPPVQDRVWKVEIMQGMEAMGDKDMQLSLGYAPARLNFLAQGEAPWLLAYGSARTAPASLLPCTAFDEASEAVSVGEAHDLGGDSRLVASRQPWPVRLIVLWVVLGAGTLLIVAMAMSLLRRVRKQDG